MLTQNLNRARLGSLLAHFLAECDAHAGFKSREPAVEDAVLVEINLTAIGGLKKSKSLVTVKLDDGADRLAFVQLDLPLQAAHLVLQLPTRTLECIADGENRIRMPFVQFRRASDVHFPAVRKRQVDVDFIKAAGAVV